MQNNIDPLKFFFMLLVIFSYFLTSLCFFWVSYLSFMGYRKFSAGMVSSFSRLILRLLGLKIEKIKAAARMHQNLFITANHLSYLDVLVVAAFFPGCFITSREVEETFFLGHLTRLAGCIFVERRSRQFLNSEIHAIQSALQQGLNIIIFPEGTSTNGESVLRFRQPLFQAAIDAQKKVLPLSICYTHLDGEPVTAENRDLLFWYADMTFWPHFKRLSRIKNINVSLFCGHLIAPGRQMDKGQLARLSHSQVRKNYMPVKPL